MFTMSLDVTSASAAFFFLAPLQDSKVAEAIVFGYLKNLIIFLGFILIKSHSNQPPIQKCYSLVS